MRQKSILNEPSDGPGLPTRFLPSPRERAAGTTLVEVMISVALVAILLVGFLLMIWSAGMLSDSSREGTIAALELHSALEDTFAVPFGSFKSSFPHGSYLPTYDNSTLPEDQKRPLRDERIRIMHLQDTGDSLTYELTIEFRNHKGFMQRDRIVTRRSR